MSIKIGTYTFSGKLFLAPMAGITDLPYRQICRRYGAAHTVSEMLSSDPSLQKSRKTQQRAIKLDEPEPRAIQLVGTEAEVMAKAARLNETNGANIIDINMGCPAKKVCNKAAGSALMRDTKRVQEILSAVVAAVQIPVTLKIRSGWAHNQRNALEIAKIAEESGITSLAIHGRTRNQGYTGYAEYETIRQIKHSISIPVIANGDVCNAADAQFILDYTSADALMLGRITQGQPWIFKQINDNLETGLSPQTIDPNEKIETLLWHIDAIHRHYGTDQGVRIARKHIGWYLFRLIGQKQTLLQLLKKEIFTISQPDEQLSVLEKHLRKLLMTRELD